MRLLLILPLSILFQLALCATSVVPELTVMLHKHNLNKKREITQNIKNGILFKYNANIESIFDFTYIEHLKGPNLERYHRVTGAQEADYAAIITELRAHDDVQTAYLTPPSSRPMTAGTIRGKRPVMRQLKRQDNTTTPLYEDYQYYLRSAAIAGGLDADYAFFNVTGGDGTGIKVFDVEGGWLKTHEDLQENFPEVIGYNVLDSPDSTSHGTSVAGVIGGDVNSFGIRGIAPGAAFYGSGDTVTTTVNFTSSPAMAIVNALASAEAGDVILLEEQRNWLMLPLTDQGQIPYLPIEWWPQDFDAIRAAVDAGIIVVEAAANGYQDLDSAYLDSTRNNDTANDPTLEDPGTIDQHPFGNITTHPNPFNVNNPSSGAILVGAGAAGFNSSSGQVGGSKLGFSDYGARVDVQAWGEDVWTATSRSAYCGLDSVPDRTGDGDRCYDYEFGGTSSASAMIAGVVAVVQGTIVAAGETPLTGAEFIQLFRSSDTGYAQADVGTYSGNIGNRPDLSLLIPAALTLASQKRNKAGFVERRF